MFTGLARVPMVARIPSMRTRTYSRAVAAPPTIPTWAQGLSVGQWVEISGTANSSVANNMAAPNAGAGSSLTASAGIRIDAWSGVAQKGNTLHCVANGGHGDYWGNEWVAVDLDQNAPGWALMAASSTNAVVPAPDTGVSYYTDGKPASDHSYAHLQYCSSLNRIIRVTDGAHARDGGRSVNCAAWDISGYSALASGTMPNIPEAINVANPAVWRDPTSDCLYCFVNYTVYKWNPASPSSWSSVASDGQAYGHGACAAVDTNRNRAVIVGGVVGDHTPQYPRRLDLSSNTLTAITLSDSAAFNGQYHGLEYCGVTDMLYARLAGTSGGTITTLDPSTFTVGSLSTTGGASIPADSNGVHNRLRKIAWGSYGGLVLIPNGTSNCWFVRLH